MKILVCISVVPDTTSKISLSPNNFVNLEGLTLITGPYEDYALSRAIEIKEASVASGIEIIIFHVGPISSEVIIRKCLALGADSAVRIDDRANDSYQVAEEIANYVKKNPVDLILMGKETIDYNSGLVHRITASLLGWESFSPVMGLEVNDSICHIKIETSNGSAELDTSLPLILGCQEPIAEWKIPSMRGIMAARTKEIQILEPSTKPYVNYDHDEVNEQNRKGILFQRENLNELIDIIKKEAKS
jgi:electron transfer flavoprotein beta subunit